MPWPTNSVHHQRTEPAAQTFSQPPQLPAGCGAQAFVLFWGLGFGSAVLMAPLPIGLLFGLIGWGAALGVIWKSLSHFAELRRGLRVDQDGLVERYWLWPSKRIRWDQVQAVRRQPDGVTVLTDLGDLEIDARLSGWRRLAAIIEQRLNPNTDATQDAAPGPEVPAAQVAEWLGVSADGRLICRPRRRVLLGWLLMAAWVPVTLALAGFYGMFLRGAWESDGLQRWGMLMFTLAHASIFFGVFSGGLLLAALKSLLGPLGAGVTADTGGLTVHTLSGEQYVPWQDLTGIALRDGAWQIDTTADGFSVQPDWSHAARLVQAVQQAVAAKRAGQVLPSGGPLPAGALSRTEPEAERLGATGRELSSAEAPVSVDA